MTGVSGDEGGRLATTFGTTQSTAYRQSQPGAEGESTQLPSWVQAAWQEGKDHVP